jgi:hypothetical protein
MCEYLKPKSEIWNFYVKHLKFEILKIEMSKFGCVNIKNWNLFVNVWKEFEILKIEMFEY